jgi:hypothetical protein
MDTADRPETRSDHVRRIRADLCRGLDGKVGCRATRNKNLANLK